MAERELKEALDECLTLLMEEQVTLEGCLSRYPEQADELRPLLEVAVKVRRAEPPSPRPAAMAVGRERMLQAVAARERRRAQASSVGLRARVEALLSDVRGVLAQRPALSTGWAAAAAVLLLLLVGGLFLRAWTGQVVPQLATLEVRRGFVEVQSPGGDDWLRAVSGQRVVAGARVRTGGDAAALLTFFDGSMTAVEAETEVAIERLGAPRDGAGRVIVLHQERGRTQHRVETAEAAGSRFEVRSPLAVMAVRGTEFAVTVQEDGTTEVAVSDGLVEVRARRSTIRLQPGWATSVQPEEPPATPFEARMPVVTGVFPPREAREALKSLSPAVVPTDTPRPMEALAEEGPTLTASGQPEETRRPPTELIPSVRPTRTAEPTSVPPTATPTATPTEGPIDDEGVPTPVGPTMTPTPTPTPTATEKPGPTAQPTETGVPTPAADEDGPSPTPTEERPGDDDVPTPGGPGGG